MKIISLNLQHGGGKRGARIVEWLRASEADAIVLTEWRSGATGQAIQEKLQDWGYQARTAVRSGPRANGILVAARDIRMSDRITPDLAPRGELLRVQTGDILLVASYFPQGKAKFGFFAACEREVLSHRTKPVMLIGDLNTGRNNIDRQPGSVKFACEGDFYDLERRAGLVDLWRRQHGPATQEWSWRSSKYGFRLDHVFVNSVLLERYGTVDCRYDHGPRLQRMSDHSVIVVTFEGLASVHAIGDRSCGSPAE